MFRLGRTVLGDEGHCQYASIHNMYAARNKAIANCPRAGDPDQPQAPFQPS